MNSNKKGTALVELRNQAGGREKKTLSAGTGTGFDPRIGTSFCLSPLCVLTSRLPDIIRVRVRDPLNFIYFDRQTRRLDVKMRTL